MPSPTVPKIRISPPGPVSRELIETDGAGAEAGGERRRTLERSVGDEDALDIACGKTCRDDFAHLSRSDQQDLPSGHVVERSPHDVCGGPRNRGRPVADRGLGAHALSNADGIPEEPAQERPDSAVRLRLLVRRSNLADDLCVAGHERIETR